MADKDAINRVIQELVDRFSPRFGYCRCHLFPSSSNDSSNRWCGPKLIPQGIVSRKIRGSAILHSFRILNIQTLWSECFQTLH